MRSGSRVSAHNRVDGTLAAAAVTGLAAGVACIVLGGSALVVLAAAATTAVAGAAAHHLVARLGFGSLGHGLAALALVVAVSATSIVLYPLVSALVASGLAACAGLARWVVATRVPSGGELAVYVGIPLTVAAATSLEGRLLVLAAAVVVGLRGMRVAGLRFGVTRMVCLTCVPAIAGTWWLAHSVVAGRGLTAAAWVSSAPVLGVYGRWAVVLAVLALVVGVAVRSWRDGRPDGGRRFPFESALRRFDLAGDTGSG